MAIEFACPACGGTLRMDDDAAGRVVRCGGCMTMLRVPDVAPSQPEPTFPQTPPTPFPESPPLPPPPSRRVRERESLPVATPTDNEPARPRRPRRPRRELPPPKRRSPLFWAAITLGVVGVGFCVVCGGVMMLLPDAKWQSYESREGKFKVDVPATPRGRFPVPGAKDPNLRVEGARLFKKAETYVVAYKEIPSTSKRGGDDGKELDEGVLELERTFDVPQILTNQPGVACGFPAREIEYLGRDGGIHLARVVVADTRRYFIVVGGPRTQRDDQDAKRFLNSFEITDPTLVAEAKKRAEQAKVPGARENAKKETDRVPREWGAVLAMLEPVTAEVKRAERLAEVRDCGVSVGQATTSAIQQAITPPDDE